MIETVKANDLDPYHYLTWVLTNALVLADGGGEWAAKLLPFNAPASCRTFSKEH